MRRLNLSLYCDLNQYPSSFEQDPDKEFTLGDGHGNALKVLHFCLKVGAIDPSSFTPENYHQFLGIYNKNIVEVTSEDVETMRR